MKNYMKVFLILMFFIILALLCSWAHATEIVSYNFNEPPFLCATGPGQMGTERIVRMPKFAPSPALISRVAVWVETVDDIPATMTGNFAIGVDPGAKYTSAANFPANQNAAPLLTKLLGAVELRKGKPTFQVFDLAVPIAVRQGDVIIVGPECIDTGTPQAMVSIIWAVSWQATGDITSTCDIATRLMVGPESTDGPGFVTDASFSNHQILTHDVTISGVLGAPSLLLNGLTSYATFIDGKTALSFDIGGVNGPILDMLWPGDFTIDTIVETSDASLDTQNRHILSGGSLATSVALAINPSGQVIFGNEAGGAIVTGTSNIADGNPHHVAVTRASGTTRLFVDGTQQGASVADATAYSSFQPYVGRYAGALGGHWSGHIRALRVSAGVARWTSAFTPPSGPAC